MIKWFFGSDDDADMEGDSETETELKKFGILSLFILGAFQTIKDNVAAYRDKAKVLYTYLQVVSQQVGGCITVKWPVGYRAIIAKLEILSFNFVPALSASCLFPRTNFYSAFLVSTAGPIIAVATILAYYFVRRKSTGNNHQLRAKAASYALAVSYLAFPSGSLITFRLFALDKDFDHGQCFLKYDYSCSCASQTYEIWRTYGAFCLNGFDGG